MKHLKFFGNGLLILSLIAVGIGLLVSPFALIANNYGEKTSAVTFLIVISTLITYFIGKDFTKFDEQNKVKVRRNK